MRICQPPENSCVGRSRSVREKAEPVEYPADLGLDCVPATTFELLLELGMLMDERVVFGAGLLHAALERPQFVFDRQQIGHGAQDLVVQRATRLHLGILRQVADDRARRQQHPPRVSLFEARDQLEQRRLARAVRADQGAALTRREHQRGAVQHTLATEVFDEVLDTQEHGWRAEW